MTFKLLKERGIFKQVITNSADGTFVDGVYYPAATPVITYSEFEGDWEPITGGQKTRILPQGLQSSYTIAVMTPAVLKTANDLRGVNFSEGDVIYLEDPSINADALPFDIFDEEPWQKNEGFKLLDGHNYYVCIRREKQ